jgi:LacI family gluconate utilization system Gnt-I transcriptional repressor
MNQIAGNPTLDDVARLAGVSTATVSRYLNNPKVVAKATAGRIAEAIARTGYIPNLGGRAGVQQVEDGGGVDPASGRFNFQRHDPDHGGGAGRGGFDGDAGPDGGHGGADGRVDPGRDWSPGGCDHFDRAAGGQTAQLVRRFPGLFLQVWELPEDPLAVGFRIGTRARHCALSCVAGINGPSGHGRGRAAGARRDGFVEEWEALGGGEVTQAQVAMPSRFGQARRVFADMRRMAVQPDVVICGSDHLAQGLIIEAHAAGLRVPDDLAVVGFGNSAIAGDMRPTITTVDIDGARIAREAIAAIRRHTKERSSPRDGSTWVFA